MTHDPGWKQIPGATQTKVEWLDGFAALRRGSAEVQVFPDGTLTLLRDSEKEAPLHLRRDDAATEELQRWFSWAHVKGSTWMSTLRRWVSKDVAPEPSVKNWFPGRETSWRIGKYLQANTTNYANSDWIGSVFEYTHFHDGKGLEGLIIMWHEGGDVRSGYRVPEVWMGDVDAFFNSQRDGDPVKDSNVLERWNDLFENGILWSMLALGLFRRDSDHRPPPSVRALLRRRPELLEKAKAG